MFIGHPDFIVRTHRAALGVGDTLRGIIQCGVVHQPFSHAKYLLELTADLRRNTRCQGRGQPRPAHLQQLQRRQLGVTRSFVDGLQPQAHRRRHQRGDGNLMLFNQREADRGAGIVCQYHAATGHKHPQRAGGAHRKVVCRRQRIQITGIGGNGADLVTAQDAVVIIVVGARDQLRRAGAAAGKLEKCHFISWRWGGDKMF
ncbi:hypothetical protein D3C75_527070 [compost metagenome]